ncbi:Apolipoprotein N-acyltransferase [Sphingomonas antarctica]|uniref:apolipoprotein N-acyltransferase n=1 Tax=Sphingomonas antarctica TaxID=2040274 RepID=UPI0039E88002
MPYLIALAAGLMSALGFAPTGWWLLSYAGFAALLMLVQQAQTWRGAALLGYAFGFGQFVVGLNWIAGAFRYQETMPVWLGWVAVVLLSAYLAVYPAMMALAAWRFRAKPSAYALAAAAAWIVAEWLRATMFTGFAWNPAAAALADTPARGLARLVGTYGLSGIVMLGAAALADRRRLIAFPLALIATLGGGWLLLGRDPGRSATVIRVVQPNISQQDKQDETFDAINFDKLEALTGTPGPLPRLILWPEAAIPWYPELQPWARRRIAMVLGPRDTVLFGADSLIFETGEMVAARNALFAMDAAGRISGRYGKAHLVPYGEYLPMRPVLSAIGLSRLVPGDIDFWAGPGPRSLDVPGIGPVGGQICYEIIFSGQVLDATHRPRFLFNPSNDAWFGDWGPPQHLAQARLRAAEEAMPIVRSTPTGISAVIDSRGAVNVALPLHRAGYIQTTLPEAGAPTPFSRLGNFLPLLFALTLALGAVALRRREA